MHLTFSNLMDPDAATIKRYGILNERQGKIPHPTTLVIDREGIIRFLEVDENFKVRPANEKLIAALEEIAGS